MLIQTRALLPLMMALLLGACDSSSRAGLAAVGVTPTQPSNLDRGCDSAAFPSAEWTSCEASNYAKTQEAAAEQLSPAFVQRLSEQSLANIQQWTARAQSDSSWLILLKNSLVLAAWFRDLIF